MEREQVKRMKKWIEKNGEIVSKNFTMEMEQIIERSPLVWNRLRRLVHVERVLLIHVIIIIFSPSQTQP